MKTEKDADTWRILVVEDAIDQAVLITHWLEASGPYEITHSQDGVHGASLAQETRWDAVITDLNLPGSDGLEVIRASKALYPDTPVIAMTAYRDQSYAAAAIREGADGFLPKPFQRETLVEKLEQLLRTGGTAQGTQGPTVLALGAHADDVVNGCGGALLRHLDMGRRVVILTLTQGEDDGRESTRTGEAELAARLMGARMVLSDLPAMGVSDGDDTVQVIERVVEAFEPEIVYTHSPHDSHPDHRAAYRATIMAAREAPTIYCYPSTSSTTEFKPALFVEITEYLDRKKEILSVYQTPDANRPYLKPSFVDATAIFWGRFAGYGKVEPMEVIRSA